MAQHPSGSERIPFITLPNWVKAAAQCGFNIEPIFAELGITTDLLHLETATIERQRLEQLMRRCVAASQEKHFPFVLGETFAFDYLPDLEAFLTTSPSLREAARVFDWVRELINPMLDVVLREEADTARLLLRFDEAHAGSASRAWFVETIFATVQKFTRSLLGDALPRGRLDFRHTPPPYAGRYEAFFRMPVAFAQPEDALRFPRRLLDAPLPGGYPALHEQARQRIERRLRALPRRSRLVAAIERALLHRPALFGLGMAAAAEELGMHPRTLQRRLRAEGTRFAELQAEARQRLARQYLADDTLDIDRISELLGYSDRRSFTRAFQRWTGLTPSAFRAQSRREDLPPVS